MTYSLEMMMVESIDRKEVFDFHELDIMEEVDRLPINGGYSIVDLEEYEQVENW